MTLILDIALALILAALPIALFGLGLISCFGDKLMGAVMLTTALIMASGLILWRSLL